METNRHDSVPDPAIRRISLYLRQLESERKNGVTTCSSKQLGRALGLTDAQVRKDLAYFGQFGRPGIGYHVDELINRLRQILGTDKTWNVLLIGAGNLGRALVSYGGFEAKGFKLVAVFDSDPAKVGHSLSAHVVRDMATLPAVVREHDIRVAIVAVPAEAAQNVADILVDAGIRGILNFAPAPVTVPRRVTVNSVDLAVQLEQISFQISLSSIGKQ